MMLCLSACALAVDLPAYFSYRNQLQTITDSAALAGGHFMLTSQSAATAEAYQVASQNPIADRTIKASELQYKFGTGTFTVTANVSVPTFVAKFGCMYGKKTDPTDPTYKACNMMTVVAGSQVSAAPRDTIMVIDTSSSMVVNSGHPFIDVKAAAQNFVVIMQNMASPNIDQLGLVSFDQTAVLKQSLEGPKNGIYPNLQSYINNLQAFNKPQFNTNYPAALKAALDELSTHGRSNSIKNIIFLTDGHPNLTLNGDPTLINPCETYYSQRNYTKSASCTTSYLSSVTNDIATQVARAQAMKVRIDTIQIGDINNAEDVVIFRQLTSNSKFVPTMSNGQLPLDYMAQNTKDIYNNVGEEYSAVQYSTSAIQAFYSDIADTIHLKLSNN